MNEYKKLKDLAIDYLAARHKFLKSSNEFEELSGNDNIVGRIGELIAIQYLRDQGRIVKKNSNPVQKGYDLIADEVHQVSVKIITAENKFGRTTRIKQPWNELIFIKLNSTYQVDIIGHINLDGFLKAIRDGFLKGNEPYADIKLLRDEGLFEKYGTRINGKSVKRYL